MLGFLEMVCFVCLSHLFGLIFFIPHEIFFQSRSKMIIKINCLSSFLQNNIIAALPRQLGKNREMTIWTEYQNLKKKTDLKYDLKLLRKKTPEKLAKVPVW